MRNGRRTAEYFILDGVNDLSLSPPFLMSLPSCHVYLGRGERGRSLVLSRREGGRGVRGAVGVVYSPCFECQVRVTGEARGRGTRLILLTCPWERDRSVWREGRYREGCGGAEGLKG